MVLVAKDSVSKYHFCNSGFRNTEYFGNRKTNGNYSLILGNGKIEFHEYYSDVHCKSHIPYMNSSLWTSPLKECPPLFVGLESVLFLHPFVVVFLSLYPKESLIFSSSRVFGKSSLLTQKSE